MSDKVFVDSNLWLYAFICRPGEESKHAMARELVEKPVRFIVSEQVIAEVSANLLRKAGIEDAHLMRLVESFYGRCQVVTPGLDLHRRAHGLRGKYHLSFWDSLIVAAALEAGCNTLLTEDMQHGLMVEDQLSVLNPLLEPAR
ncbi:MAG: PIN domain-containing protein [Sulfurimicrobium sp.]|nr:PIN domain-containing protein [Sulfurimicrobium sp.]